MTPIEAAWSDYRGWGRRSRTLQTEVHHWNRAAAACAVLAAVLGAAAASGVHDATAKVLSALAAIAAAVTHILRRHLLATRSEARWILARASAEAIKSECFLFAAGLA